MRWLGVINLTWENLQIAKRKAGTEEGVRSGQRTDLRFAICRFSQVRFITPSHLTHNLFFYFQYFLVLIWFIFSMGRTIGLGRIWSFVLGFWSLVARLAPLESVEQRGWNFLATESDVTIVALKLAMRLHFPLPKIRTIGDEFTLSLAKNSHSSFLPSHFPFLPS